MPKKKKKQYRYEQTSQNLHRLFASMDREAVHIEEQREYEERPRREAREHKSYEKGTQMAMQKEIQKA